MKKLVLLLVVVLGLTTIAKAQEVSFKEYVGKYVFSPNQYVPEAVVEADEANLKVTTIMGSFTLEKKGVDTFYLAQFDALVVFKRTEEKNIESVIIAVQGMELVGKKEVAASTSGTKEEEVRMEVVAEKLLN